MNTFFSHILKAHLHFTCSNKIFLLLRDIQVYHTFFSHLCIFHQRWNTFFTGYLFFLLHLFHPLQIIYLFFLIPFIPIPFFPYTIKMRPLMNTMNGPKKNISDNYRQCNKRWPYCTWICYRLIILLDIKFTLWIILLIIHCAWLVKGIIR